MTGLDFATLAELRPMANPSTTRSITPSAWFVVKSKISEGNQQVKVFLNICTEPAVPSPPALSDQELRQISAANNANELSSYYVPVIMSDVRRETDKAGKPCKTVDCVLNPQLRSIVERIPEYRTLLIAIVLDQADSHIGSNLSRDIVILNIQSKGRLVPRLVDLPAQDTTLQRDSSPMREIPKYKEDVVVNSAESSFNVTISVPKMTRAVHTNATLDIESRRIILECGQVYALDLAIDSALAPKGIEIERATAEWKVKSAQLVIHAPLLK